MVAAIGCPAVPQVRIHHCYRARLGDEQFFFRLWRYGVGQNLLDARKGVLEQSRRHASIAALLQIPHVVVAVNKMDLVDWDEAVFDRIALDFAEVAERLGITDYAAIPLSALRGDNVVDRSPAMPWYDGPPLLGYLEDLEVASSHDFEHLRLPVQYVILAGAGGHHDERRYAGQLAGGVLRPGDEVVVLPRGLRTRVASVHEHDRWLHQAFPPQSVSVTLADELDVGRGDMLVAAEAAGPEAGGPVVTQEVRATVCWMDEQPLVQGRRYVIKHTSRTARALVAAIHDRLDLDALERRPGTESLAMNEIGDVSLRTSEPLVVDPFTCNRVTGRFILIDEATNATAGAGMVVG